MKKLMLILLVVCVAGIESFAQPAKYRAYSTDLLGYDKLLIGESIAGNRIEIFNKGSLEQVGSSDAYSNASFVRYNDTTYLLSAQHCLISLSDDGIYLKGKNNSDIVLAKINYEPRCPLDELNLEPFKIKKGSKGKVVFFQKVNKSKWVAVEVLGVIKKFRRNLFINKKYAKSIAQDAVDYLWDKGEQSKIIIKKDGEVVPYEELMVWGQKKVFNHILNNTKKYNRKNIKIAKSSNMFFMEVDREFYGQLSYGSSGSSVSYCGQVIGISAIGVIGNGKFYVGFVPISNLAPKKRKNK